MNQVFGICKPEFSHSRGARCATKGRKGSRERNRRLRSLGLRLLEDPNDPSITHIDQANLGSRGSQQTEKRHRWGRPAAAMNPGHLLDR